MSGISESNSQSLKSSDINVSFKNEVKIFHQKGFKKDLENERNNYFNASLHCLTNINSLSFYIINSGDLNSCYIKLLSSCYNELDSKYLNDNVEKLKKYIFETCQYNKEENNPKNLIYFLLKDLKKNNLLSDSVIYKFQYKCENCKKISEYNELKFIEFNIPEIISFYNKKNKNKITIYDCFHYYFNSLNIENSYLFCEKCHKRKFEVILKSLQKDLIIFIDYGKEKKEFNKSYEFDEIINFKNFTFLNKEDRNKEFFLSTFIVCKNMGYYFETFYTMARNNENSNYYIYNGMDVRPNIKVSNKLKKKKIDLKNYKESWPVVLVYSDNYRDIEYI